MKLLLQKNEMEIYDCLSKKRWLFLVLLVLCSAAIVRFTTQVLSDDPEISLTLDEPWEDMRQRSSAAISPALPGRVWFGMPKTDARLRFIDPQYGFETPLARFFTIGFKNERVTDVRMSPQIEPLSLDDALKVVLDLQDQWHQQGWFVSSPRSDPPITDTPQGRNKIRGVLGGRTFWQASDKYQIMLGIGRFKDKKKPDQERFLITLELAKPWIPIETK